MKIPLHYTVTKSWLALLAQTKLLLVDIMDGYEEKRICQINSYHIYHVPRGLLIYSSKGTTEGTEAEIGVMVD